MFEFRKIMKHGTGCLLKGLKNMSFKNLTLFVESKASSSKMYLIEENVFKHNRFNISLHITGHFDQFVIKRIPQVFPQILTLIKSFN